MEPSFLTVDEYVPKPLPFTPNIFPVSSNETSTVGGSTDSTLLAVLFPVDSPSISPSIVSPPVEICNWGVRFDVQAGGIVHRVVLKCRSPLNSLATTKNV